MWGHNQHVISLADSRNTGSFGKPEPITIAQCFSHGFYWSVSFRILWGHNQLAISLVDLQVHLNRWRGSANYRRSFSAPRILLVSQFPKFVGDTTHGDFHSLSVSDRHAPANQRLSSATRARSFWLSETDWYGLLFGHSQHKISLADF